MSISLDCAKLKIEEKAVGRDGQGPIGPVGKVKHGPLPSTAWCPWVFRRGPDADVVATNQSHNSDEAESIELACFNWIAVVMEGSMRNGITKIFAAVAVAGLQLGFAAYANASSFSFSTGNPDGLMAAASRPSSAGAFEIETADDFILSSQTSLTNATFTGLLTGGASVASVKNVIIEIYHFFPTDSDVGRTSGPPTFSTAQVPTRVNSPSDNALDSRSSSVSPLLSFSTTNLLPNFMALNSIQPGGIHPMPLQTTGGNRPVTGQEVEFDVSFTTPFDLPADHYFFVPQVELDTGAFLWLSAPFSTGVQGWTRDQFLDPDWLRVGTDIVGGSTPPKFNFAFSLTGTTVPLPGALPLFAGGLGVMGWLSRRRKRTTAAQP